MRRSTPTTGLLALASLLACGASDSKNFDFTAGESGSTSTSTAGSSETGQGETSEGFTFDVPVPDAPPSGDVPVTCGQAEALESVMGCRFYGVELWNLGGSLGGDVGFSIANVQVELDASVRFEHKEGGNWVEDAAIAVAPGDVEVFVPEGLMAGPNVATGIAYRISSDVPIVASQISPYEASHASSDASLLFPVAALDHVYDVVGRANMVIENTYATVVATEDATEVEVMPSSDLWLGEMIIHPAGQPLIVMLNEGDALTVFANDVGDWLRGTRVTSLDSKPIAVFSGCFCQFIPDDQPACDHLEEQLLGLQQWGTTYVAARMPVRDESTYEAVAWQVFARDDGTTVTFAADPAVTGLPPGPVQLDAGEAIELWVSGGPMAPGDFLVAGDKPIAVAQYMTGASNTSYLDEQDALGDPAMALVPPVGQFHSRYVVLSPPSWERSFLVIVRETGASVTVDGAVVNDAQFLAVAGGYGAARVEVDPGVHRIESDAPIGAMAVGIKPWDSYAYLAGSGTARISEPPG